MDSWVGVTYSITNRGCTPATAVLEPPGADGVVLASAVEGSVAHPRVLVSPQQTAEVQAEFSTSGGAGSDESIVCRVRTEEFGDVVDCPPLLAHLPGAVVLPADPFDPPA
ncbi:hypothetical protein [Nonomuraea typhae]|uniref:Uncharacterized protein n=1 Tax=Nonomuraea typhae TaxID=2603600 RepID=A0ABW7Z8F3_9ACTN